MISISDYFKNKTALDAALIHRSYCNEHPGTPSNERLEFLGDSVLSVIISNRLYLLLPNLSEGELTARRSYLVQTSTLAQKAKLLGLDSQLKLSKGEEDSGGRLNPSLLANTFEAVLGTLFLDSGLENCKKYLTDIFPNEELTTNIETKDPKSKLQELSQAHGWGTPLYVQVSAIGPDHAKKFTVSVTLNKKEYSGTGQSKQKAEIDAATIALKYLL